MKIRFNKFFYDKKAIEDAAGAFDGICSVNIINSSIDVEIEPKQNIGNLVEEFSNYVLGIMKKNMLF